MDFGYVDQRAVCLLPVWSCQLSRLPVWQLLALSPRLANLRTTLSPRLANLRTTTAPKRIAVEKQLCRFRHPISSVL